MTERSSAGGSRLQLTDFGLHIADRWLLRDCNLGFGHHPVSVVIGRSGAGKSLWLKAVAGLLPTDGPARVVGRIECHAGTPKPRIGVVFQDYAVFDELTAAANVQLALDHAGGRTPLRDGLNAAGWLDLLDIPTDVPTRALSGGQKQRLAIARTLASAPDFILYDEPTSGLDAVAAGRVARLIEQLHTEHRVPAVVVTHDYPSMLPIADQLYVLRPDAAKMHLVPRPAGGYSTADVSRFIQMPSGDRNDAGSAETQSTVPGKRGKAASAFIGLGGLRGVGRAAKSVARWPWFIGTAIPTSRWLGRYAVHYAQIVGGATAWAYLAGAGAIAGFVIVYFTIEYLPYRATTEPLLIDDLIAAIGFAMYRVLIPILATVLIAARSGAALAADIGNRRYGGTLDAMRTLGLNDLRHTGSMAVLALSLTTPVLTWWSYQVGSATAALTFAVMYPDRPGVFWWFHFQRALNTGHPAAWFVVKTVLCGVGIAAIASTKGFEPKRSATDVTSAISSTILWATLYTLLVHLAIACLEFRTPPPL